MNLELGRRPLSELGAVEAAFRPEVWWVGEEDEAVTAMDGERSEGEKFFLLFSKMRGISEGSVVDDGTADLDLVSWAFKICDSQLKFHPEFITVHRICCSLLICYAQISWMLLCQNRQTVLFDDTYKCLFSHYKISLLGSWYDLISYFGFMTEWKHHMVVRQSWCSYLLVYWPLFSLNCQ